MKQALVTVSFSVDRETRDDLDRIAAEEHRSKSDLFRELWNYYALKRSLRHLQEKGTVIATRLGLESDDDVFHHLSED